MSFCVANSFFAILLRYKSPSKDKKNGNLTRHFLSFCRCKNTTNFQTGKNIFAMDCKKISEKQYKDILFSALNTTKKEAILPLFSLLPLKDLNLRPPD
jgi:hypothetical protein